MAHYVDDESGRIYVVQSADPPAGRSICLKPLAQQFEKIILPKPAILGGRIDLDRLPNAIGTQAAARYQNVDMDMPVERSTISMDSSHYARHGRKSLASRAHRMCRSHRRRFANSTKKGAIGK